MGGRWKIAAAVISMRPWKVILPPASHSLLVFACSKEEVKECFWESQYIKSKEGRNGWQSFVVSSIRSRVGYGLERWSRL